MAANCHFLEKLIKESICYNILVVGVRVNRTLGTSVPPEIEKQIEMLVKKGYYKTKSDFLYQAVLEKLKNERELL